MLIIMPPDGQMSTISRRPLLFKRKKRRKVQVGRIRIVMGNLMIQSLLVGAKLRKRKLLKVMLRWKQ
jgi:hypothetical protein